MLGFGLLELTVLSHAQLFSSLPVGRLSAGAGEIWSQFPVLLPLVRPPRLAQTRRCTTSTNVAINRGTT